MIGISWHFRKQRALVWVSLALLLGGLYAARANLTILQSLLRGRLGLSAREVGNIVAAGLATFGVSSLLAGPLVDRLGGRLALYLGVAGSAVCNILLGLGLILVDSPGALENGSVAASSGLRFGLTPASLVPLLTVVWIGNNLFQAIGTLAPLKILAAWFRTDERGLFVGIFRLVNSAAIRSAMLLMSLLLTGPWEYLGFGPAALLLVLGLATWLLVKNTPHDAGFEGFETGDPPLAESLSATGLGTPLRMVFAEAGPWIIAVCIVCMSVVVSTIQHWFGVYVVDTFGIPATQLATFLPYQFYSVGVALAGSFGLLAVGYASDRSVKFGRVPFVALLLVGQTGALLLLWQMIPNAWMAAVAAVCIVFFAQSGLMLAVTVLGLDLGRRRAVGTAVGFFTFANYLGGALTARWLGSLLDHFRDPAHHGAEFSIWPLFALPFAALGTLLSVWLWYRGRTRQGLSAKRIAGAVASG